MENNRINKREDIRYLYTHDQIAYWQGEKIYYDPKYNTYHYYDGCRCHVRDVFSDSWFKHARFKYVNGTPCYLPEQDPSYRFVREKSRKRSRISRRSKGDFTNFLILDTMSLCSQTDNTNNHPKTSWARQKECHFSIKSLIENRCMYWGGNLDGHCSCVEAYLNANGQNVDTTRIENIRIGDKVREEKSRFEGLPFDHHFEEARNIAVRELSRLNDIGELPCINNGNGYSVFYHKKWHVLFNGNGQFLEELTKKMRESEKSGEDFIKEDKTFTR